MNHAASSARPRHRARRDLPRRRRHARSGPPGDRADPRSSGNADRRHHQQLLDSLSSTATPSHRRSTSRIINGAWTQVYAGSVTVTSSPGSASASDASPPARRLRLRQHQGAGNGQLPRHLQRWHRRLPAVQLRADRGVVRVEGPAQAHDLDAQRGSGPVFKGKVSPGVQDQDHRPQEAGQEVEEVQDAAHQQEGPLHRAAAGAPPGQVPLEDRLHGRQARLASTIKGDDLHDQY